MENRYLSEESLPDCARTASIMKDLKLLTDDVFPAFGIRDEYLAEECPPLEEPEERNDTVEVCAPPQKNNVCTRAEAGSPPETIPASCKGLNESSQVSRSASGIHMPFTPSPECRERKKNNISSIAFMAANIRFFYGFQTFRQTKYTARLS